MIKRRASAAGLPASTCCHTFRATGITAYLSNGGTLEHAQRFAGHASPKTTKLYDRTADTCGHAGRLARLSPRRGRPPPPVSRGGLLPPRSPPRGRQSPGLTRRAPHPGRRRRCRPPTRDRRTSPASAGCACGRRRRPAPRPGASVRRDDSASWVAEGYFPARPEIRARGPAAGLRPASWSGTGPWPVARCRDRRPAPQRGDLFAKVYERVWPPGCWGSPGRLHLFSPLPTAVSAEGRRRQPRENAAREAGASAGHDTLRGAGRCSSTSRRKGEHRDASGEAVARRSDAGAGRVRVGVGRAGGRSRGAGGRQQHLRPRRGRT